MADLRKYCATSGGISSRLLLESVNGEVAKDASGSNTCTDTHPRMTKRFYQSTSELELNSLITVDENIMK